MHIKAHKVTRGNSGPVGVKGGMSLRNGMWHGLRNDLCGIQFMENGAKKKIQQESMRACLPRLFWRQFGRAIDLPVHLLLLFKQG